WVVVEGSRNAEPVTVRRLPGPIGSEWARPQPTHVPRSDLVSHVLGLGQLVWEEHAVGYPGDVIHVPVGVGREGTRHRDDRLVLLRRRDAVQAERAARLHDMSAKGDVLPASDGPQEVRVKRVEPSAWWSVTARGADR